MWWWITNAGGNYSVGVGKSDRAPSSLSKILSGAGVCAGEPMLIQYEYDSDTGIDVLQSRISGEFRKCRL